MNPGAEGCLKRWQALASLPLAPRQQEGCETERCSMALVAATLQNAMVLALNDMTLHFQLKHAILRDDIQDYGVVRFLVGIEGVSQMRPRHKNAHTTSMTR